MRETREKDSQKSSEQKIVANKKTKSPEFVAEVLTEEIVVQPKKKALSATNISQLITHSFNEVISLFVTTFLISYIYSVSTNYMLNIGLFYVFNYLSMGIFYLIISKIIVKTNRVIFYRLAMKSAEGTINTFTNVLKQEINSAGLGAKLGALALKKVFKSLKHRINYTEVGGSPFLGLNKILIKSHGSSKAKTIYTCVLQVLDIYKSNYIDKMRKGIESSSISRED